MNDPIAAKLVMSSIGVCTQYGLVASVLGETNARRVIFSASSDSVDMTTTSPCPDTASLLQRIAEYESQIAELETQRVWYKGFYDHVIGGLNGTIEYREPEPEPEPINKGSVELSPEIVEQFRALETKHAPTSAPAQATHATIHAPVPVHPPAHVQAPASAHVQAPAPAPAPAPASITVVTYASVVAPASASAQPAKSAAPKPVKQAKAVKPVAAYKTAQKSRSPTRTRGEKPTRPTWVCVNCNCHHDNMEKIKNGDLDGQWKNCRNAAGEEFVRTVDPVTGRGTMFQQGPWHGNEVGSTPTTDKFCISLLRDRECKNPNCRFNHPYMFVPDLERHTEQNDRGGGFGIFMLNKLRNSKSRHPTKILKREQPKVEPAKPEQVKPEPAKVEPAKAEDEEIFIPTQDLH